jgi:hypothetical protein
MKSGKVPAAEWKHNFPQTEEELGKEGGSRNKKRNKDNKKERTRKKK